MGYDLYEQRLNAILPWHFDPENGTPYWLARAAALGLDPGHDLRRVEDLTVFGPMPPSVFAQHPIEYFVPRRLWADKARWVVVETGGATGAPQTTVYLDDEFEEAFVTPFVEAAQQRAFPAKANWLWVGPTGPHVIGRAARACARALGAPDPFCVDFDPRWIRRFAADSLGFHRYFEHVLEQALHIVETQQVEVLFSTPAVLTELHARMSEPARAAIAGVHFGGMSLNANLLRGLHRAFPAAVFISGYGNTLFGMCPEFSGDPDVPLDYFPHGHRLLFETVPPDPERETDDLAGLSATPGGSGQLVVSRFDRSGLIIRRFERDQATLVPPPPPLARHGFVVPGVRDPRPLPARKGGPRVAAGLY